MATAIALPEDVSAGDFQELAKSGDYLPSIRLMQLISPLVAQKKASPGNYALVRSKDQATDLGDQIVLFPLAWRPLALNMNGDSVIANFDQKSDTFKKFSEEAAKPGDTGYLSGPQFLLWMPSEKAFVTYHLASISAKRVGEEIRAKMGQAMTLKSNLVQNKKKQNFYVPLITDCSLELEIPDPVVMTGQIVKFKNPKSDEVADAAEARADR